MLCMSSSYLRTFNVNKTRELLDVSLSRRTLPFATKEHHVQVLQDFISTFHLSQVKVHCTTKKFILIPVNFLSMFIQDAWGVSHYLLKSISLLLVEVESAPRRDDLDVHF